MKKKTSTKNKPTIRAPWPQVKPLSKGYARLIFVHDDVEGIAARIFSTLAGLGMNIHQIGNLGNKTYARTIADVPEDVLTAEKDHNMSRLGIIDGLHGEITVKYHK